MFTPKVFKEGYSETIQVFIKQQPQATVIAQMGNGLVADYLSRCWTLYKS